MGLNIAKLKEEAERLKGNKTTGNNSFLDNIVLMPEGSGIVSVRILPGKSEDELPFVATRIHKINDRNYHCSRVLTGDMWRGDCPLCSLYNHLWKEADQLTASGNIREAEKKKNEARALKPNERYYYNAIVIGKEEEGPKILSVGKRLHKKIITAIFGDTELGEDSLGDITDRTTGRNLKIVKEVTPGAEFPNYDRSQFASQSTTVGTSAQYNSWMDTLHDLTTLRAVKSFEEMEKEVKIYLGLETASRGGGYNISHLTNANAPQQAPPQVSRPVPSEEVSSSIDASAFYKELESL